MDLSDSDYCLYQVRTLIIGHVVVKKDLVLTCRSKYFSHGVLYVFGEPDYHVAVCICDQCI